MAHHRRGTEIVGHGATVREINQLSTLFDHVRHVGCLHQGLAPNSALPYDSSRVTLVPVPPAGGARLRDKLAILRLAPTYLETISRELDEADVVHVRCPANVSMMGILALALKRRPAKQWIKYAGNWKAYAGEPVSYRLQRWWLERPLHGAVVTVNGRWPGQRDHVYSFDNPCLTDEELSRGAEVAAAKRLARPLRLVFVGGLHAAKGPDIAVRAVATLAHRGTEVHLDVVGEGAMRSELDLLARELDVAERVTFHGAVPRPDLEDFYSTAHLNLLPSRSEGWPKVLSEGMAYGVVPVATAVGSISQYLGEIGTGRAIASRDPKLFASAIQAYTDNPVGWRQESEIAVRSARRWGYAAYLDSVRMILNDAC